MDLTVGIGGIRLKNPVMTASGTFGYGDEYAELFDINEEAFWKAIGYVNYTACERALLNYFGDQGHV
jgi:dihydroorotate dehydrogenase